MVFFGLCLFTPLGELVLFLLDKIGFHVGKKYGLKATVALPKPKDCVSVDVTGKTLTDLRPAGFAEFNGKRTDVLANEKSIGKGETIRVVKVEGNRIYVERKVKHTVQQPASGE